MVRKQHTGRKKKKGKKNRTCTVDNVEETYKNAPHSFMFHRGRVGKYVKQLVKDVRRVGEPFTARNLQVRDKNVLKDFVSVAGLLHVTHFMIFTKTESSVYMRLCRLPRGPTITFKVVNYCLTPDVVSSLKKPSLQPVQYLHHPLLVMNNFSGEGHHMKMMATMFQNMFPSINVHKVNLNEVRRCVLVNYDSKTKQIDFRHYNIRVAPVGVSRKVRKIVQAKVPNLSRCTDISDYMTHVRYDKLRDLQEMLHGQVQQVPEGTSVRWLSVESAVKMIFKYIDAIILSLEDDKDKTGKAAGLWKYLSTSLFILITALMIDVLSVIGMLSLTFQKDKINLSMIRHNVQSAIQTLNDMKNGSYSVDQLLQDLGDVVEGPASYKNVQFTDNANLRLRFTRLREQYINQLVENLEARFPKDNMDLLECLDMLFNPNRYPDTHGELGNYGMVELDNLCQFYGAILDVDRCKAQFLQFKYLTLSYKQVNDFEQHIKMLLNDYSEMYPDFIKLASIAIIIPVSSAPCERGFSHQNALKTKSRNRLNPERLNRLLMIRLVGPPRCEMNFLSAARAFGALKLRKK